VVEKAHYLIAQSKWDELLRLGEPAIRPLIQALNYEYFFDGRQRVVETLGKIRDPLATEALIQTLGDQELLVRYEAAEALGKIREDRALDPLINALQDNEYLVRKSVATSLGRLGFPKAIEPLEQALKDLSSGVRREAAGSLDKLGWTPKNDTERAYYLIALERWREVDKLGEPAIRPLIYTLRGFDESIQDRATSALARIAGEIGESAISLLIEALKDEASHVRSQISLALGKIGKSAVPLLMRAQKDDDLNVRSGAKNALGIIDYSES
jgi:HEAT repeat protein